MQPLHVLLNGNSRSKQAIRLQLGLVIVLLAVPAVAGHHGVSLATNSNESLHHLYTYSRYDTKSLRSLYAGSSSWHNNKHPSAVPTTATPAETATAANVTHASELHKGVVLSDLQPADLLSGPNRYSHSFNSNIDSSSRSSSSSTYGAPAGPYQQHARWPRQLAANQSRLTILAVASHSSHTSASISNRRARAAGRTLHQQAAANVADELAAVDSRSNGEQCSATVNYGASVGDISNQTAAEIQIFVASFDVVVNQDQQPPCCQTTNTSDSVTTQWVFGWHFTAGEHIQQEEDVFGNDSYAVLLLPTDAGRRQAVAVFGNGSFASTNNEVTFNFVGQKGPQDQVVAGGAPFRVAPPSHLLLNNHYCWPLQPPDSTSSVLATEVTLGDGSGAVNVPMYGPKLPAEGNSSKGASYALQWPYVAVPQMAADRIPHQLIVEYLPVEFRGEQPGLFAETHTQVYFGLTNNQNSSADPVYLDQITIQYWFHGSEDPPPTSSSTDSSSPALAASQITMTCSDATPAVGCSGIAWNVTSGLANTFGARYVLNIWFPIMPSNSRSRRVLLLPDSTVAASNSAAGQQTTADGTLLQPLIVMEAIFLINYRRFFASTNAQDDYSFLNTPIAPPEANGSTAVASSQSSNRGGAAPIQRLRQANPRMPAYLGNKLAWGSPPKAKRRAGSLSSGSYCQRNPDGSMVCGVDTLYCCKGDNALSSTAPADWKQRLLKEVADNSTATAAGTYSSPAASHSTVSGSSPSVGVLPKVDDSGSSVDRTLHNSSLSNDSSKTSSMGTSGTTVDPSSNSSSSSSINSNTKQVVVLSVTLPVAVLGLAAALYMLRRCIKHRQQRGTTRLPAAHANLKEPALPSTSTQYTFFERCFKQHDGTPYSSVTQQSVANMSSNRRPSQVWLLRAFSSLTGSRHPTGSITSGLVSMGDAAGAADSGSCSWTKVRLMLCCQSAAACHANDTVMVNDSWGVDILPEGSWPPGAAARQSSVLPQRHQQLPGRGAASEKCLSLDVTQAADGSSNHDKGQRGQQQHSSVLTPEQCSYICSSIPPCQGARCRAETLPEGVLSKALEQHSLWQQQHRQQQLGNTNLHARNATLPFNGSLASSTSSADGMVNRPATWNGRWSADAFALDFLGQFCLQQAQADSLHTSQSTSHFTTNLDAIGGGFAGAAAAAAVEAAIAAINAALAGNPGCTATSNTIHQHQLHQQSSDPSNAPPLNPVSSLAALVPSPADTVNPAPSFYTALMATGGVLKPLGGPPIPLNVDYTREIQPYLGRLLGRGGFGNVYQGTWCGRKVAVKLLTMNTDDPAVLDIFLKEVALCACLRNCDRVVKVLGACLGGQGNTAVVPDPMVASNTMAPAGDAEVAAAPAPPLTPPVAASGSKQWSGTSCIGSSSSSSSHSTTEVLDQASGRLGTASPFCCGEIVPATLAATTVLEGSQQQQHQQQQGHHNHQPQQLALIMELMEGGSLAQRIYHPSKRRLTYLEILHIALDITAGLEYLHPVVVHRDLKPHNVLLNKQGRAAIADFGISRFKDPHRSYLSVTQQGGTPNYMAPELFNGTRVDEAADVYSLGCILYECVARKQPFGHLLSQAKSFNVLFKIILAVAINKERPAIPSDTPPQLASLINRCWFENPAQRPRVSEVATELRYMIQEELSKHAGEMSRMQRLSGRTPSSSTAAQLGDIRC